jgi:hypothetical protein
MMYYMGSPKKSVEVCYTMGPVAAEIVEEQARDNGPPI